jgi:hypothetical protein
MARFSGDLDNGIISQMEKIEGGSKAVMRRMVEAGADVVLRNMRSNMRSSFKTTRSLEEGLGKTKVYDTPSDDGVSVKVGFSGYSGSRRTGKFKPTGVPVPLIASARDRGSRRGEARKPFFKKSFNKAQIEAAMKAIEPDLWKGAA